MHADMNNSNDDMVNECLCHSNNIDQWQYSLCKCFNDIDTGTDATIFTHITFP